MIPMRLDSGPSEDKNASIDCIESGDELEVEQNRQMVVHRRFKNSGTIIIRGTFILRSS